MAQPNAPITELDFDAIKTSLKDYLKTQTQFKDYNFEGSNLSVLLDVLAFNTYQNNFYTNMAINEMFLDTAVLTNSVVSHAKELNYLPRSRKSAKAVVRATILTNYAETEAAPETVTIPAYSNFNTTYLGTNFTFITDKVHLARRTGPNQYLTEDIEIFEGQMLTSFQREGFIVDDDGVLKVALSNDNCDTDTIAVFVDAEATDDQNVFTYAEDIFGVGPTDKVFYVEPYFDNRYAIYFGKDIYGEQPQEFQDVRVRYRVTSGEEGNGANSFTASFIEDAQISVTTISPAAGGAERESLESIRFNAPKSLQVQQRAVTSGDYETLLKQKFPEITAVAAYSGDQLNPPQFGKVAISVYLRDNTRLISNTLANTYINYLIGRSPIGIEPVFVQTEFLFADVEINAYYTTKLLNKSISELETLIRQKVGTYSDDNLEEFNKTFRRSKLAKLIDDIDSAILSNVITARPIIEYSPNFGAVANPTFKFESQLIKPYPFVKSSGFTEYKPAIESSTFDIGETCVYLQDDGLGNIQVITFDQVNPEVLNPNAGTVNYETGEVKLIKFFATRYSGSGIKIKARTKSGDIKSPLGRVFVIRDEDVRVKMILEEQQSKDSVSTNIN